MRTGIGYEIARMRLIALAVLLLPVCATSAAWAGCPEIPPVTRTPQTGSPFATDNKGVTRLDTQTSDKVRITGGCVDAGSLQIGGMPAAAFVPDLLTLLLKKTTDYPGGLIRFDYASGQGAPPLYYKPSNSACSLNAGAGDNGSQVAAADGKCWLAVFLAEYNVLQFGAIGDASTDNAAAIRAAVAAAGNRPVFLPVGQYRMCSEVTSSVPIHVYGMGRGSGPGPASQSNSNVSQILMCSSTQNGFVVTSIHPSYFHDFQMNVALSGRPMTAGYGIELIGTGSSTQANTVIERVGFTNVWNPIHAIRPQWLRIQNNYFDTWGDHAVSCVTTSGVEASCGFISQNYFFGNFASTTQQAAIYSEIGYIDVHDNELLCGASCVRISVTNNAAGWTKIHNNTIENCINYCIYVESTDGHIAAELQINDNEFSNTVVSASNVAHIVVHEYLDGGGVGQVWITDIHIVNNVFRSTTPAGHKYVWLQAGKNVTISNNIIEELGANNPTGIYVLGATSHAGLAAPIKVLDNIISGTTAKYQFNATTNGIVRDLSGTALASLPANAANGSQMFVTDADPATGPCTAVGAQTGSTAFRQNNAWKCF